MTTIGELRTVDSTLSYAPNGGTQVIQHPGATYVKVHFSSLRLAQGDYVTVSSRDGKESYRYDRHLNRATGSDYTTDGQPGFWAMSVEGDTAVVTLHSSRPHVAAPQPSTGSGADTTARKSPRTTSPPSPCAAPTPAGTWSATRTATPPSTPAAGRWHGC
ncbi:hypothetical protein NKG94_16270 [Micromonospora sp. M12]